MQNSWKVFRGAKRVLGLLLPEASFGLRVLSLPASVCPCVRVSVNPGLSQWACPHDELSPVQVRITIFGSYIHKWLRSILFCGVGRVVDLDLQGQIYNNSKFNPFWACPHHNSSPVQARITKFGSEVQNSLVKILILLGGDWPWVDLQGQI